jgi:polysaccharide export outer membrane protein
MARILFWFVVVGLLCPRGLGAQDARPAGPADVSLLPGDAVKVQIWQEADLSGTFRVGEDTTLTLPLLGVRKVAGLSAEELRSQLVRDYSTQLKSPSIEVSVIRRISVLGEVANPGLYDLEPTMRMSDVIALAGGVTPEGSSKNVDILRANARIADDVALGDVVGNRVQAGDQIFVNKSGWFSRNGVKIVVGIGTTATFLLVRQAIRN